MLGRALEPSQSRVDDGSSDETFPGFLIGYLGFSREEIIMGEGATSMETRGPHATWWRAGGGTHATTWCGRLVALLRLSFGLYGRVRENRSVAFRFVRFREYFLITFLKQKIIENMQLALWHLVNRLVLEKCIKMI